MAPKEIATRLAVGVAAGVLIGAIDLWAFELSARGFFAGLAAGVGYGVSLAFLLMPGVNRSPLWLANFAAIAGGFAGSLWWLVAHTGRLWVAICLGSLLALLHFAGEGLFSRRATLSSYR